MPGRPSWTSCRTSSSASGPGGLLSFRQLHPDSAGCRVFPRELRAGVGVTAFGFGEKRRESSIRGAIGDQRRERCHDSGSDKERAIGLGREKRRVRPVRDFVAPRRQQARAHPLDHLLTVRADGPLIGGGLHTVDRDRRRGRLAIGDQRVERIGVRRHVVQRPRPRRRRGRNLLEVRDHHRLDCRRIEVAHRNHRHQIGAVPTV